MFSIHPIVWLLVIMVGLLSGLIIWGFWQAQTGHFSEMLTEDNSGKLQLWLLTLAVFALGVFVTFVLLILIPEGR